MVVVTEDEHDVAMAKLCERLRMLFAEAGYPDAKVYNGGSGVFVDGVPEAVQERAFDLINASAQ